MEMNPSKCPKCGSDEVSFYEVEWEWGHYSQTGTCEKCACEWLDIFTLSERIIDEE